MKEFMNNRIERAPSRRWELPLAAMTAALFIELIFLVQVFFVVPTGFFAAILPGVVADATNAERGGASFGALAVNPVLQSAAQRKADDMASKGYFAHVAPDGTEPWAWFRATGYAYAYAGENLAVNFMDSKDVVDAWMRSPSHRANIMNERYTEIGIGIAEGTYQGERAVFVVQFFGAPVARVATPVAVAEPVPSAVPPAPNVQPLTPPSVAGVRTVPPPPPKKPKPPVVAALPPSPEPIAPLTVPSSPVSESFVAVKGGKAVPAGAQAVPVTPVRESSVVGELIGSPRATTNLLFLTLATALALALLYAGATAHHAHFPRILAGGTLGLLVIVTFLAVNQAVVLAAVQVR